jgi:PAS domain S-box-containing protein
MASKNWQAGGKFVIPAQALICLLGTLAPFGIARAQSSGFAPASYIGSADPDVIWELLIGGIVVCSFLAAIALWVFSALRKVKRSQLRRNAFVSSALNNLKQGVVMTDSRKRIVYCNDRYLEIYGLVRADIPPNMTGPELLAMRRSRGVLGISLEEFYANATRPEGLITELPGGRSIQVRYFALPNGGSVATHEDCTEQRSLSRQLASTTKFLESVLDNVPVCVAAKSIEDGRYIFANRAFERFSRFSRDKIVGKRADEIFQPDTAAGIEAADDAALHAADGQYRSEIVVERGSKKRILASNRVIARDQNNQPEFLIALFDDVTDRKSLSKELENSKKFLELVVDNIPVSLIVERVSDGRYLLANRSAEAILNRRREDATGLTAADIFNPKEAKLIIARDPQARPADRGTPDQHQGRPAAVPDPAHDGARRRRRAAIPDQNPRRRHRSPPDRVAHGAYGVS